MPGVLILRGLIVVAVGVGILLGAGGVLIYEKFTNKRRRVRLKQEVAQSETTVSELPNEFNQGRGRRRVPRTASNNSSSTAGTDQDNDVFYDCSDENNVDETETNPGLAKLLDKVDQLLKGPVDDSKTAYSLLLEHEHTYADNVDILWRLAKACHIISTVCEEDEKKKFIFKGVRYAEQALKLDDSHAEAHKWFAVTVGSYGEFLALKERIEAGFLFKKHVEKALALNPRDPYLHHLLGRFTYEIANLSWIERRVAATFYAELPSTTFSEAVDHCLEADSLSTSPWKENCLLLAKCYISLTNYAMSATWLRHASEVPVMIPDNHSAQREVQSLLLEYGRY